VLFLDELPEFKKYVLEVLRLSLEDVNVTISRAPAGQLHAGGRHEPLPVWVFRRFQARLPLLLSADPPLPLQNFRAAERGKRGHILNIKY
jgi:hypothetical protein